MTKHDKKHQAIQLRVNEGLGLQEISCKLGVSKSTASLWLKEYPLGNEEIRRRMSANGLRLAAIWKETPPPHRCVVRVKKKDIPGPQYRQGFCKIHGEVRLSRNATNGSYQCMKCNVSAVVDWRKRAKAQLVTEHGGECRVCGYNKFQGALDFHHLNPTEKSFTVAQAGRIRSIERMRSEASKCILVCANCHREIEAGLVDLSPYIGQLLVSDETVAVAHC